MPKHHEDTLTIQSTHRALTIENQTPGNLTVKKQLENPMRKPQETVGILGEETSHLRNYLVV